MTDDMDRDTSGGPLGGDDQDRDTAADRGGIGERVDQFVHGKDAPGIGGGGDWDLAGSAAGTSTDAGVDRGELMQGDEGEGRIGAAGGRDLDAGIGDDGTREGGGLSDRVDEFIHGREGPGVGGGGDFDLGGSGSGPAGGTGGASGDLDAGGPDRS